VVWRARDATPVDSHQRHPRLHESPCQEATLTELRPAVAIANSRTLLFQSEGALRGRRVDQVERLPRPADVVGLRAMPINLIQMSIHLLEQRSPLVEAHGRYVRRQGEAGELKLRRVRVAIEEPRIAGAAEEPAVLAGPGQIAVVGRLLGQGDRGREGVVTPN